jgi:hypothetical protein
MYMAMRSMRYSTSWSAIVLATVFVGCASMSPKQPNVTAFEEPGGRFSLAYPRGWEVVTTPGSPQTVVRQRNGDAAVVFDRGTLPIEMPATWDDVFREGERKRAADENPRATDLQATIVPKGLTGRKEVLVKFSTAGQNGLSAVVRHTIPIVDTTVVYRVTSTVRSDRRARYESEIQGIVESLKIR